jgi:biotin carboxyl carrier protein
VYAGEEENALKLRIKIEGKTYEAEVEILDSQESAPEYPPYPPVQQTFVPAAVPQRPINAQPDGDHEKECRSPVAGMVTKVNVQAGEEVGPDGVVIVLESMKMEMQITRPQGGLVKRVLVTPGFAVRVNEVMVEFA